MNDCFFCGPTENPLTEEHVWPQWVSRLLFGKYNSNYFVNIRSTGDNTTGLWKSRNIDVTTKTVCDKCNNVWLSSFENTEIKPIATPLITGNEDLVLAPSAQWKLSTWAYKMAMLLEVAIPPNERPPLFFTPAERKQFRDTTLAHERVRVFLSKYEFGQHPAHAHLPMHTLTERQGEPDEINRFKAESDWAEDVELASVHRVLERLRAAINWGLAQTPPLFARSPFHRFGVRLNKKAEVARDRRVSRDEEKRLLDTALGVMNTAPHQYFGELLHNRIIGAMELCCRRGEMLVIQNKRVNWDTCQIGIPGATAKDKENRRIPFNPNGRLAAVLKRRAAFGPDAFVFGSTNGEYQPTIQTAWETLKLLANGITPKLGTEGLEWNAQQLRRIDLRWHDLRHEGACRLLSDGVDIRIIQLMLGHASIQQTQRYLNVTDEELRKGLEVSWINQGRPLRAVSGQ